MADVESVGQRIKRERMERSMTQRDLAEAVGVGVPHISKIEASRENPSDDLLKKIARYFDCDFEELLIAARRIPLDLMERLAVNPEESLKFLRTLPRNDR